MLRHPSISLGTPTNMWNWLLTTCSQKEYNLPNLKGKHLIPPLTFSTKIQSDQITYLPGILPQSVRYGLFLTLGMMEFVLTGLGEKNQFTAKLRVQTMFMCSDGWLWKYSKYGSHALVRRAGGGFNSKKLQIVGRD